MVSEEQLNKVGYLQMVDIFQDLTEAEIEEIDRATTLTSSRRGKILYMPEDQGLSLVKWRSSVRGCTTLLPRRSMIVFCW